MVEEDNPGGLQQLNNFITLHVGLWDGSIGVYVLQLLLLWASDFMLRKGFYIFDDQNMIKISGF